MIQSIDLVQGLSVFKALSSPVRVKIFALISQQEGIHITLLAQKMNMPISTLVPHLYALSDCNLIHIVETYTTKGRQKSCFLDNNPKQLLIHLTPSDSRAMSFSAEIPVGHYTDFSVSPTCGLASNSAFIGFLDEPRYFAHPTRYCAEIIWWGAGYVEYVLPNLLPHDSVVEEFILSFEIGSEAPGCNSNWPSDITFSLNGICLGTWTSPGDFGDRRGIQNPEWWYPFLNQYGLLKRLSVKTNGTFLDNEKLSDVTAATLSLTDQSVLKFRFSVPETAIHVGGCTLFGKCYGDHPQGLRMEIIYREKQVPLSPR